MTTIPAFGELIAATTTSAIHLEMRDAYTPQDPVFLDWMRGEPIDAVERHREWYDVVRATVARGVTMRRARIVSEPLADFTRFEYECTAALNIAAGEQVRWLPRRLASDLCLPGNDFWVFDSRLARFNHFAGDGSSGEKEMREEPGVVQLCNGAFEAVWERAIDHSDYKPL
ncbi:DUF6879 family protein [Streptosporangium sp. NPDC002524]|uniref:DUF6879 family protein n=1 Tax=Streptosporangium sp. NPDC002524 TaxID=3154537 RepID=UPI00332C6697